MSRSILTFAPPSVSNCLTTDRLQGSIDRNNRGSNRPDIHRCNFDLEVGPHAAQYPRRVDFRSAIGPSTLLASPWSRSIRRPAAGARGLRVHAWLPDGLVSIEGVDVQPVTVSGSEPNGGVTEGTPSRTHSAQFRTRDLRPDDHDRSDLRGKSRVRDRVQFPSSAKGAPESKVCAPCLSDARTEATSVGCAPRYPAFDLQILVCMDVW